MSVPLLVLTTVMVTGLSVSTQWEAIFVDVELVLLAMALIAKVSWGLRCSFG